MDLWQEIVKTAVVGVERQPLAVKPSTDVLGHLLSQLDQTDREGALLGAAAAAALYERAGRLPVRDSSPLPVPCVEDDLPRCSKLSAQHLKLLLGGEHKDLLPEWLAAMAKANRRVPEECLPALLNLGGRTAALREAVIAVIGGRGQWLAAQNEDWRYAVGAFEEESWQTGGFDARLAFLRKLRATDPARARELVRSTWDEDKADYRSCFLAAFELDLGPEDESFLEFALNDKSKGVRREAARLLVLLPQSQLRQKITERARPLLTLKKKRGKKMIEVTLPDTTEEEMARFGINPKPSGFTQMGDKAWWLKQLVSLAPPSLWNQSLGETADELMKAVLASDDWRELLLEALAMAAKHHQDREWIEALFDNQSKKGFNIDLLMILGSLPAGMREEFALKALRKEMDGYAVLKSCSFQWGGILSLTALGSLLQSIRKNQIDGGWQWSTLLSHIAIYFNPDQIAEAIKQISAALQKQTETPKCLDAFLATLRFRDDMLKEINR